MFALPVPRGRSRQISRAALARLASQERRAPPPPPATLPDYYDSPPSPPRSLEDQVHVAYAHDDIHLAKILLLRLKGIHVTGNDDPRIAQVKDEDFDFCFVPYGRLLDDDEEKSLKERQRAELERVQELRRTQRLKDCERIWDQGKKRLRELKTLAIRRKDLEEKRRAEEQRRSEESCMFDARFRRMSRAPTRTVVSYKLSAPFTPRDQDPFVYDLMPQPAVHPVSRPQTPSQPTSKSPFTRPLFDDSRAVPFTDVLTSMQGPLFPPEQRSPTPLLTSRRKADAELLESLLTVVESEEEQRRRKKGKAPERPVLRRKDSAGVCPTCSSSSLSSDSSSSSRRSWLSFSTASSSSVSTAATTPSSSPPSSLSSKASPLRKPRPKTWFLAPRPSSSYTLATPPPITPTICRPCNCHTAHLTPVSPADAPLPILPNATSPTLRSPANASPTDSSDDTTAAMPATSLVLRRFAQFIDLARGFQNAYMSAAMFVVPPTSARAPSKSCRFRALHAPGARARAVDVRVFLNATAIVPSDDFTLRPIPLRPLATDEDVDADDLDPTPRTVLPIPLPYETKFKPHPVPPRSPFRAVHGVVPPGNVVLRVRNVENPVCLRVRAMENVVKGLELRGGVGVGYAYGVGRGRVGYGMGGYGAGMGMGVAAYRFGGMGRPVAMEGTLACGREKLLRIAYEGIGSSRLRFEVRAGEVGDVVVPGAVGVEGRGRGRGRVRRARVERSGEGEGDEDGEWIRGDRRKAMWW
ncbi:hypothetical protein C0995_015132 [Termitomyces sp. Mi166|nr:hypothetical protein C0995_015132 [Termitomyces sp. Mi166\